MSSRRKVDLARSSKLSWMTDWNAVLDLTVLVFGLAAVVIAAYGDARQRVAFLAFAAPLVTIMIITGQEAVRRRVISLERRMGGAIANAASKIDEDYDEFHTRLHVRAKSFEDRIEYHETRGVYSLFAYARAKAMNPRATSILQTDSSRRTALKESLTQLSGAMEVGNYYDAYRALAGVLNLVLAVASPMRGHHDPLGWDEVYECMLTTAHWIRGLERGLAQRVAHQSLLSIVGAQTIDDRTIAAVLIFTWVDERLYTFTLPNEHVSETGIFFCSEYELLALDLLHAAAAFHSGDWLRVQGVIGGNYRRYRLVPKLTARTSLKGVSPRNDSYIS